MKHDFRFYRRMPELDTWATEYETDRKVRSRGVTVRCICCGEKRNVRTRNVRLVRRNSRCAGECLGSPELRAVVEVLES